MSLSGGSWDREGPGGGRDGVIALRTIREIAFSDCARPRQSPVSLSLSLSVSGTVCHRRQAATNTPGPSAQPSLEGPTLDPNPTQSHRHHQKGLPTVLNACMLPLKTHPRTWGRHIKYRSERRAHLHASGGHWEVVVHLCYAGR